MHSSIDVHFWHEPALGGPSLARTYAVGYEFERHIHDELVIVITEAGYAQCGAKGLSELSEPGTIWVSGSGEYHFGRVRGNRWRYRAIYLDGAALTAFNQIFYAAGPGISIPLGVYHDPQLASFLINAHKRIEEKAPLLERQTLWWSAMELLLRRYGRLPPFSEDGRNTHCKMYLIRDYLRANFANDISIRDLTQLTGLSRHYLIRAFKKEFGLPPHSYVNQIRVNRAKRMLAAGTPPASVAIGLGFYDQSHLHRHFIRNYNLTPGQYAAAMRAGGRTRSRGSPISLSATDRISICR